MHSHVWPIRPSSINQIYSTATGCLALPNRLTLSVSPRRASPATTWSKEADDHVSIPDFMICWPRCKAAASRKATPFFSSSSVRASWVRSISKGSVFRGMFGSFLDDGKEVSDPDPARRGIQFVCASVCSKAGASKRPRPQNRLRVEMGQEPQSVSVDRITHDAQGAGQSFFLYLQGFAAKTGFGRLCGRRDTERSFRKRNQSSACRPRGIQLYPRFRQPGLSSGLTRQPQMGVSIMEARHGCI